MRALPRDSTEPQPPLARNAHVPETFLLKIEMIAICPRRRILASLMGILLSITSAIGEKPRVFVTTDIGINDPDDDQSVCHLLHYADEIELVGLVPDLVVRSGNQRAKKRLNDVIDAYQEDFDHPNYRFHESGHPTPEQVRSAIKWTQEEAVDGLLDATRSDDPRPLYVLVWGRMHVVGAAIRRHPEITSRIRLLTIGTHLKANRSWGNEKGDGRERNWNWSEDRDHVFRQHPDLWWVESDWTYSGMFPAPNDQPELYGDPVAMRNKIKPFGSLGRHLWHMGNKHDWSGYFRCGDTPSLSYLLDDADDNDPTQQGWAGAFLRPFSDHPNYFIGIHGDHAWDYADPTRTWENAERVFLVRTASLRGKRREMYEDYLRKLATLYGEQ